MHDLEVIVLIEICQAQFATRKTLYDSIDMRYLWSVKFIETESRMVVARGWGEGEMERCLMGNRILVLQDEKFWRLVVQVCNTTEMYIYKCLKW